jgi:predicted transcriptional regulator
MDEYLKEAIEVAKAQAGVREMSGEDITAMVQKLAADLQRIDQGAAAPIVQEPAADPKKSIREASVVCLECGKAFKVMTKKHLATHGLTTAEYKAKWGLPKGASLVAKGLARDRRKKMQEMELWKRRGKKGKGKKAAAG